MKFFDILEKSKIKDTSQILYSLINRIPIIVFGDNSESVNDFLEDLSNLINFRKEFVFFNDFVSKDEYDNLLSNEDIDYNTPRIFIRCPCNVALRALEEFDNLNSWLIGFEIPNDKKEIEEIKNKIRNKSASHLRIFSWKEPITIELDGIDIKKIDFSLEQNILQKISQDTEKSIARMKRVLSEKVKSDKVDRDLIQTLLNFETEQEELKLNILKKEIQNFYYGSKRAFYILIKLKILKNIEVDAKIGDKTLLETIDFEEVNIERVLSFIHKEWKEDFSNLIESTKRAYLGDKIQGLFG